jgi:predicted MFS family arabinose efflux permease
MIPLVWRFLPEPASFLLSRPSLAGIERLNASLLSLGQTPLFALPPPATAKTKTGLALVLGRGQIRTTSALAAVNVLFAAAAYFVLSWLPQLISDAGFAPSRASLASALASASGIVGGLALGWIARNRRIDRTTALAMMSLAFALCAFGLAPASFGLLLTLAGVMGFFLFAGVAGLYATIASRVAPEARATASGLVIGMGRISSAVGPLVAGALFADNWGRAGVTAVFASCAFAAAIALLISGKTEPSR